MSNIIPLDPLVCRTPSDFARELRRLANEIEAEGLANCPKHVMVLVMDIDNCIQRESYGSRDFSVLHAVAMLEWAKLEIYNQTK